MTARDVQSFCREAENYAKAVVTQMDVPKEEAAARVVMRLSTVLEGMMDGMPAADMAVALGAE